VNRILVIGATSAIAAACARLWASEGASFFLVARSEEKLAQTAADLHARGALEIQTYEMDVNRLDAHAPMLEACNAALGGFDVALIAHGTLPDQTACERDPEIALREFQTNGTSAIALLTLLANRVEEQRAGTLAVITSVAGDRGRPSNYVYGSAKAAVSTFCEGLRARLFKAGGYVIDIRPGFVATPMTNGLALPGLLVASPQRVARRIVRGVARHTDVMYVPSFWWWILLVIRWIPDEVFKRIRI
jgi:hypothetical protein